MATLIRTNLAQQSDWKGADHNGIEPAVVLPSFRENPLLLNGADGSALSWVEAYKRLRTQVMKAQAAGDVGSIAICSVGPSDGKTLTAFNLACACAQLEGSSVLLVDADLRTRGLSKLIPDLPSPGLADFLSSTLECENIALRTNLNGLFVVGAGNSETSPAELFSRGKWQEFLNWAKGHFKFVIVDSLPVGVVADSDLVTGACDRVLVIVRALKTSRATLEDALGQLDPGKILGVVWNGAQHA